MNTQHMAPMLPMPSVQAEVRTGLETRERSSSGTTAGPAAKERLNTAATLCRLRDSMVLTARQMAPPCDSASELLRCDSTCKEQAPGW